MKIKNTFISGVINKDSDERVVSPDELIDAENFLVTTSSGSNQNVGKNVPSNVKKSNLNFVGAKTTGKGVDSTNEKVYNFICADTNDYIIEHDLVNDISTVVLQYTSGGVLNFSKTKRITNVDIIYDSEGDGNLIAWSGDHNPPRAVNIEKAKLFGANNFTETDISVMKPSPIFAPVTVLTTSVDGETNNFIKDKFITFAYRYKYADNTYSAPSSWSRVCFNPNLFKLDYQTYENLGMLNLANAVDVTFNTGSKSVLEIDLMFRESNNQTIYVVQNFNKADEGWLDNESRTFQFSKSKIYQVLSDEQFTRNFDNVPLQSNAQTLIGNRIAYANYLEGRDLGVVIDYDVTYTSSEAILDQKTATISNNVNTTSSAKSNLVDFIRGNADGGANPTNQMNYVTNEVSVNLTAVSPSADNADFIIDVSPKPSFITSTYNLIIREGTTVLQSYTNLTGNQTRTYNVTSNKNVTIYVTSTQGIIYDLKLNYNVKIGATEVSRYDYFSDNQLSFPSSVGYPTSLEGNTVISTIESFDMTGFQFKNGKQIIINFELFSSLVANFNSSSTFFFNLTQDYTDLADFIANSGFKTQLEDVFSLTFKNNFISNAGTIVTFIGFKLNVVGNTINITTPIVEYTVTEPSSAVTTKYEYYLVKSSVLQTSSSSSNTSMHSNRDYEVGLIYMDKEGRKSTVLVSKENTVHIPAESSDKVNVLNVVINNNPPTWAKYYKFAIKQVKRDYDIIYGNLVYSDGIYRWIRLVGENKNKVKEGDLLTIKSDFSGALETLVKTKVLEISTKSDNFIAGNLLSGGEELKEEAGLYMKIKQGAFDANVDENSFKTFNGYGKRRYASDSYVTTSPIFGEIVSSTFVPYEIKAGSTIRFYVDMKAYGNIAFNNVYEVNIISQSDYPDVKTWFNTEVAILSDWINFVSENFTDAGFLPNGSQFRVKPNRDGTAKRDIITSIIFDINFSGGILVFETEPFENLSSSYFETPETYIINDGNHQVTTHVLNDAFNCYSFGNGVESYKIRDAFLGKSFSKDANPNNVNNEGYQQIRRFADITYSGVFNSNTNVNRLNEFNLSLANFKDDIDKSYGDIVKIKGENTNLDVYQEDKISYVLYEKDLLYNADGTTNLSKVEYVLGVQKTYEADNGISFHPDSQDSFFTNSYFTDTKRGVVLRKNDANGVSEISVFKMRSYFKTLFRDNKINHINGKYDSYNDFYILNIQYNDTEYVTWVFSDRDNGWLGKLKFNPEDMCRVNNQFVSFKDGELYLHNQENIRNTFYGIESPSKFSFNFSQEPSTRKSFKNIEIEGSIALQITTKTDLDKGYINQADFVNKEGVFYAYLRHSNDEINTKLLSCQGIGNASISGLVLTFADEIDNSVSVGDEIRNLTLQLVGTIVSKTAKTITLNTVSNIVNNDFVLATKTQSISNNDMLGYYMKVDCEFSSNEYQEIFAINSTVSKSFS